MAKKVISTLRKSDSKNLVKLITSIKSEKSKSYAFKERIMTIDQAKELLQSQNK